MVAQFHGKIFYISQKDASFYSLLLTFSILHAQLEVALSAKTFQSRNFHEKKNLQNSGITFCEC